ncbi:MAG: hypothetical protein R2705_20400 [Ilumatobacteraceae bacterium]
MVDLPGGPEFVAASNGRGDDGDAALPIDPRLPRRRAGLFARLRPAIRRTADGDDARGREFAVAGGDAWSSRPAEPPAHPRGSLLTHGAVAASRSRATVPGAGVTPADKWLACLPLSHVGELSVPRPRDRDSAHRSIIVRCRRGHASGDERT